MKNKSTLWYIRQQGNITGPFPSRVITNNILLGRRDSEPKDTVRRRQFHTLLMRKFREKQSPIMWPLLLVGLILI